VGASANFAFWFWALMAFWWNAAPSVPVPDRGLIYRMNNHGFHYYMSAYQVTSLGLLLGLSIGFFLIAFVLTPSKNLTYRANMASASFRADFDDPRGLLKYGVIAGFATSLAGLWFLGSTLVEILVSAGFVWNRG
jgi:hypothetical protein